MRQEIESLNSETAKGPKDCYLQMELEEKGSNYGG
jgi:hypothetical protein